MKARRTYAATDHIGLAVSIVDALLGEKINLNGRKATLKIRIEGTAPIELMEIVRSGRVITTIPKPAGDHRVNLVFTDSNTPAGSSYYYVRLVQEDGAIAWGSPIWGTR